MECDEKVNMEVVEENSKMSLPEKCTSMQLGFVEEHEIEHQIEPPTEPIEGQNRFD